MCSEGVSVWFACKLCKSFFLNADDFAYHKKKSHIQEFRSTKFIVFEEQTTPPASPPENWVSFLSPKEETQVHKIISSPSTSTRTTTNVDSIPSDDGIQISRNEKFIEIDLERNKVPNFSDHDDGSNDADRLSNNVLKLNCDSYANADNAPKSVVTNNKKNDPLQISVVPSGTNGHREQGSATINKSALKVCKRDCLRKSKRNIHNIPSKEALLKSVIQSPHNPYVYLKRLKLLTVQTAMSSHTPSRGQQIELAGDLEDAFKEKIQPDFPSNLGDVYDADFNPQLDLDAVSNTNLVPVPVPAPVSYPTTEILNFNYGDLLEVVKTEYVDCEFPQEVHDPFESESRMESLAEDTLHVADSYYSNNLDSRTQAQGTGFYCISCKQHFTCVREIKEHNKNYHETPDGKRRFDCPDPGCGRTTSSKVALKRHLNQFHSNSEPSKSPQPNCEMSFKMPSDRNNTQFKIQAVRKDNEKFVCPYLNCGKSTNYKCNLKSHIQQVHSNLRPFKCPHRGCNMTFKVSSSRNQHLRLHTSRALLQASRSGSEFVLEDIYRLLNV